MFSKPNRSKKKEGNTYERTTAGKDWPRAVRVLEDEVKTRRTGRRGKKTNSSLAQNFFKKKGKRGFRKRH